MTTQVALNGPVAEKITYYVTAAVSHDYRVISAFTTGPPMRADAEQEEKP